MWPPSLPCGQGLDSESLQITGTSVVCPHNGLIIFILFLWEMGFCFPSGKNPNGFKSPHVFKMGLPIFDFKWEAMASANTAWHSMSCIKKKNQLDIMMDLEFILCLVNVLRYGRLALHCVNLDLHNWELFPCVSKCVHTSLMCFMVSIPYIYETRNTI